MNNYKISCLTFSLIFMCLLNSLLLGIVFPYVLHESKTSFYLAFGISFLVGFVFIFIFLRLFNFLPDKDIFKKIESIFPKWISKFISFVILVLVFGIAVIILWRLVTFISSEFLVETPTLFIELLIAAPLFYIIFYDFDVIGRLSVICLSIAFFLILFNIISLFSQIDINNLKPLLNFDLMHTGKSVIVLTFMILIPGFLTLIIPKNNVLNNEKVTKSILISYILEMIFIFLVFFVIVSVLGIDIANIYTFPSYVVLKTLSVLSFIQNTENISILVWVLLMTFSAGFCMLFLKSGVNDLFNINKKKTQMISIIIVFVLFFFIVLYLLPKEIYLNKYHLVSVPLSLNSLIFLILVVVLILGKIIMKLKK